MLSYPTVIRDQDEGNITACVSITSLVALSLSTGPKRRYDVIPNGLPVRCIRSFRSLPQDLYIALLLLLSSKSLSEPIDGHSHQSDHVHRQVTDFSRSVPYLVAQSPDGSRLSETAAQGQLCPCHKERTVVFALGSQHLRCVTGSLPRCFPNEPSVSVSTFNPAILAFFDVRAFMWLRSILYIGALRSLFNHNLFP